ncbi:MAG: VWA domain-containing protein [Polyangiaceae bacterium]
MGSERSEAAARRDMGVQIVMRWGDAVVAARDIEAGKAVHIGEGDAANPVDFTVPEDKLGRRRAPLVLPAAPGAKGPRVVIAPGSKLTVKRGDEELGLDDLAAELSDLAEIDGARTFEVRPGAEIAIDVDDIRFEVRRWTSDEEPVGRVRWGQVRRFGSGTALSLGVHVGLILAVVALGARGPDPDEAESERQLMMQQYLARADEKQMEALEAERAAEASADQKEAGTGTRARGEEGSMGAAAMKPQDNRYGVAGPSDAHVARDQALRDAQQFGMVGTLNSGAGGDPNAFGNDPLSARGNAWGSQITDEFGSNGLVTSGMGEGGGGRGEGIGLGSIGTIGHGAGTGTGQGFGNGAGPGAGQGFGSGHGRLFAPPPPAAAGKSGSKGGAGPSTTTAASPAFAPQKAMTPPPPVDDADKPLDPNGRFATTYRPGGGHLAAFDSAVARGVIPAAEREVVSDVGARYVPNFALPEGKSLGLQADLERGSLAPAGGAFHLRLSLKSAAGEGLSRPDLAVTLVLDVSGSMSGAAIDNARAAANKLVDRLQPNDRFSLVTFSSDAQVLIPIGAVGPRRGFIHAAIDKIGVDGGTNISEGLRLGYEQAKSKAVPDDAVRCVMLLSDGHANAGVTASSSLARMALDAFQDGVETSTFGLGADYDGPLMSGIAGDGAGGYYYLRDSEQIAPALALELDKRMEPVATAVEVRVRLSDRVDLLRVYGSKRLGEEEAARVRAQEVAVDVKAAKKDGIKRDRQDDTAGGMRFFIPAFARDDSHALLLKLRAPEGVGSRKVALVELRYKDRVSKKNVTIELPVAINYADSDAASAATMNASVARTVQGFLAGETLMTAAARVGTGDRAGASALLDERESILRTAAEQLQEPAFLRDADRLVRLRSHLGAQSTISEPLALAMLLETAGRSHLH